MVTYILIARPSQLTVTFTDQSSAHISFFINGVLDNAVTLNYWSTGSGVGCGDLASSKYAYIARIASTTNPYFFTGGSPCFGGRASLSLSSGLGAIKI